jgi:GTP cyclohydrolase III
MFQTKCKEYWEWRISGRRNHFFQKTQALFYDDLHAKTIEIHALYVYA